MSSRTKYALLLLVVLGVVLKFSASTYDPGALIFLGLGMAGMAALMFWPAEIGSDMPDNNALNLALSTAIFLFAFLLQRDPLLEHVPVNRQTGEIPSDIETPYKVHAFTLQIMVLLTGLLWWKCLAPGRRSIGWREVLILLAFVALVVQRYATVMIVPYAPIDVFVSNEDACKYLIEGKNPYTQFYRDIYAGNSGYDPGFGYWPGYLYWATLFKYFFNDVRFASATSDVLTSVILLLVGHKLKIPFRTISLLSLLWLTYPVGMFVVQNAWIDPNLIFFSALVLLCLLNQFWIPAGVIVGWIAGTKQYGGLVGLMTLVYVASQYRHLGARVAIVRSLRIAIPAAVVFVALLGPFLYLDGHAFYKSTIGVLANAPLRPDALSLVGLWLHVTDNKPSGTELALLGGAVNLLAIGESCWWLYRSQNKSPIKWAGALMFCYFVFFFTGKFAFCNYYYFVSFFILAYFVLALGEDFDQPLRPNAEGTV